MPEQFDIPAARKAGYTDDEILQHLTASRHFDVDAALKSGYSKAEVIDHLASVPAPSASHGATGSWEPNPAVEHPYLTAPLQALAKFGKGGVDAARNLVTAIPAMLSGPNMEDPLEAGPYAVGGVPALVTSRLLRPQVEEAKKAATAESLPERIGHGMAAALPMVGPMAAHLGERAGSGDVLGAAGEAAVYGLAPEVLNKDVAGEAASTALEKTTALPAKVRSMAESYLDKPREPVKAMTQALKPLATNIGFTKNVQRALPVLKATETELGRPIASVQDLLDSTKLAKKQVWSQYEQILGPQADRGVDASAVADAIEKSIPLKLKVQNHAAVEKIQEIANTYRRTFTLGELDDMLTTSNAELSSYYGKYPAARSIAERGNPEIAQNVAEATALRKLIYDQLDNAGEAKGLKQTYGALMNIEKEGQRRLNVAARQNPDSLSEQLSRWEAAMKLGKAAVTFPARPVGAIGDVVAAYAGRKVATAVKQANSADSLIANVFRNYQTVPLPSRPILP